jgi:hypothetical protein
LDILVEDADGKFIGIEYERSVKSRGQYVGYVKWDNGRKISYCGLFRKRQDDVKLKRIILICETDSVLRRILGFINMVQTPDDRGNYKVLDKFYLISKAPFKTIKEMFLDGQVIYSRSGSGRRKEDYQSMPFLEMFS